MNRQRAAQLARFLLVTGAGLVLDLSVAWAVSAHLGLPLTLAAAMGFACGAAANFVLNEYWTFRDVERKVSLQRIILYAASLAIVLGVRLVVLVLIEALGPTGAQHALASLVAAAGISFVVNFILSRWIVFRPSQAAAVSGTDISMATNTETNSAQWQVPAHETRTFHERRSDFALVIPVINEGEKIRTQLLQAASAHLPVDIVIADGGSTDGVLVDPFLQSVGVRTLLTKTGPGRLSAQLRMAYAWCLRDGYEGIITIDGNNKDNVGAVTDFVARLKDGFDYVQGSRYRPGGLAENTPLERTIGNRLIHAPLMSLAGRNWFTDTTNGYRGYSRRYLLDPRVAPFRDSFVNYELLFYLTVRAGQLGYRVCETAVQRRYPDAGPTPTKIQGWRAKYAVLEQLVCAVAGMYAPRNQGNGSSV